MINICMNMNRLDLIGNSCSNQAFSMAQKLKLFDFSKPASGSKLHEARPFTAWYLFSWQTSRSYYFFRAPFFDPPNAPLPHPQHEADWYPEVRIRYPSDERLTPINFACSYKAKIGLRLIINEIGMKCFGDGRVRTKLPSEDAFAFKAKLNNWFKALPTPFNSAFIVLPIHMII